MDGPLGLPGCTIVSVFGSKVGFELACSSLEDLKRERGLKETILVVVLLFGVLLSIWRVENAEGAVYDD